MTYISLRAIREQKGLTLAQLAGKTSISLRTLQAYESGDRAVAPDDLRKLARVLVVSAAEILQPAEPPAAPVAPPTTPSAPAALRLVPDASPASANGPPADPANGSERIREFPIRPSPVGETAPPAFERGPERGFDRGPRRPFGAPSVAPRPVTPRAPRPPRAVRPPSPATSGQLEQLRNFARRLGLEETELVEEVGAPLESLTLPSARAAITKVRARMEESGTWRPRVGEGPDQEGEYLNRLREAAIPIEAALFGGEKIRGLIDSFTPYVIQVRQSDGTVASLRKLAVVYYRTLEAVDDAR
ncbi:MAG TPA: helix-turn-helix transcriptional regulator [Chloroflexota bacterium]|nr:helix-turn-helix transcriptional regulator [Chloroflexota bacterium]